MTERWRPNASLDTLKARAELNASVRAFFSARGVLEVDTPVLSAHATVDRHIDSYVTRDGRWLHTSPEFAMKRLLAAGAGPIWQMGHVFRIEESGRHHNPEFTLLEWYQPGFDHHRLMDEVEAFMRSVARIGAPMKRMTYRDAFITHAGFDPHRADLVTLSAVKTPVSATHSERSDRDFWLNLWMGEKVAPALGLEAPCFVHDFPASQAALARVRFGDPPLAERFELFWKGIELANGFHELLDAVEQDKRFRADQAWRAQHGRAQPPYDANLIAALGAGMPACAGVALGIDRLLMLMLGLPDVASTLAFAADRA